MITVEKCGLLSDFQFNFRSSCLATDLLTVVSDRIFRAFNKPLANRGGFLALFCYFFLLDSFWSNILVVRALDSQYRGPRFKIIGWLQGRPSLSSFGGSSDEYQELSGT